MQQLIDYLNSIAQMSPELEQHLRKVLKRQVYKKKEYILKKGEVCRHIRFIESGIIRIYETNNEKEYTTWIQKENEIFIAIESFYYQTPSNSVIQAVQKNTIALGITFEELVTTIQRFPEFEAHQNAIKNKYQKIGLEQQAMLRLSAPERYDWLMNRNPEVFLRVQAEYIYSFLGITKEMFFQVRKIARTRK